VNLVFPMAGLSQRFTDAGYDRPKYMLDLHGRSVLQHVVQGFSAYFHSAQFIFIARDVQGTVAFVESECRKMGIARAVVHVLDAPTRGQAETVALAVTDRVARDAPITIFNIDTFRPRWHLPTEFDAAGVDGYLEVFRGAGANWSFVRPADPARWTVAETAEKRPISDLCSTGLYHFRRSQAFLDAYGAALAAGPAAWAKGELYVAPLYNHLIARGGDVRFALIPNEEVVFCGTPQEYEQLLKKPAHE
jgi:hypothetical protein